MCFVCLYCSYAEASAQVVVQQAFKMKFAIAYYLLLIYATVILKPLIPVAEDAIMHCFAEAYHIATVHAIEGKDHVEKEMAASGANDDSSKNQKADKAEQTIHETAIVYTLIPLHPCPLIPGYALLKESLSNICIDFINPPPRA
jgi:hypothetical protein